MAGSARRAGHLRRCSSRKQSPGCEAGVSPREAFAPSGSAAEFLNVLMIVSKSSLQSARSRAPDIRGFRPHLSGKRTTVVLLQAGISTRIHVGWLSRTHLAQSTV